MSRRHAGFVSHADTISKGTPSLFNTYGSGSRPEHSVATRTLKLRDLRGKSLSGSTGAMAPSCTFFASARHLVEGVGHPNVQLEPALHNAHHLKPLSGCVADTTTTVVADATATAMFNKASRGSVGFLVDDNGCPSIPRRCCLLLPIHYVGGASGWHNN